jgi:hypothetical protein
MSPKRKHNLPRLEKALQLPHSHWMWLLGYEYAQNHCPGEKKRKRKTALFNISAYETIPRTHTVLHYKNALRECHI